MDTCKECRFYRPVHPELGLGKCDQKRLLHNEQLGLDKQEGIERIGTYPGLFEGFSASGVPLPVTTGLGVHDSFYCSLFEPKEK